MNGMTAGVSIHDLSVFSHGSRPAHFNQILTLISHDAASEKYDSAHPFCLIRRSTLEV
jgi:hypothetical protein